MNKLLEQLEILSNIKNNWDGYGGIPPTEKVIEKTKLILESVTINNTENVEIFPNPNGTISMVFGNSDHHLSLEMGKLILYIIQKIVLMLNFLTSSNTIIKI